LETGSRILRDHEQAEGLPCFDPMRSDLAPIVAGIVAAC